MKIFHLDARSGQHFSNAIRSTHLFVFGLQLLLEVAVRCPPGVADIVYLLLIASLRRLRQLVSLSLGIAVVRRGELFLQRGYFFLRQSRSLQARKGGRNDERRLSRERSQFTVN